MHINRDCPRETGMYDYPDLGVFFTVSPNVRKKIQKDRATEPNTACCLGPHNPVPRVHAVRARANFVCTCDWLFFTFFVLL